MIKLTVLTGTEAGTEFTPTGDAITLGRSNTCTIVLHDAAASRRHSSIERHGNEYILTDLQSGNGTFVNSPGNKISAPYVLQEGDEILIGKSRVRVTFPPQVDTDVATSLHRQPPPVSPSVGGTSPGPTARAAAPPPAATSPAGASSLNAILQPDVPIVVTVVSGPNRGMVYSPARDVFTIGRATTCDIALNDSTASRVHASIKREAGRYRLYDENSVNGVYLRTPQNRVYHSDLADGDTIFIGQNQLRVEIHLTPPPMEAGNEDATRISGTIAGKSFTFTLSALGGGSRGTHTDEGTHSGAGPNTAIVPDDATRVGVMQSAPTPASEATSVVGAPGAPRAAASPPAAPVGPKITLRVIEGKDQGTVFTPAPGETRCTIGRGEQASFRLQDRGASRIHCAIEISPAGFFLVDNGSLNGTFLNQSTDRITRVALKGGEEILLADTRLKVEITLPEGVAAADGEEKTSFVPYHAPTPAAPTASPPAREPAPVIVLEEPATEDVRSRSAAFKDRLATIAKESGVTLRPFTVPGTARQWATLALMLLAALSSYGFALLGRQDYFAGGPISESHAKLEDGKFEQRCTACHPAWGLQPVNATCAATDCHADVLKVKGTERDDCVSCHTEHRGRNFAINGGKEQCWSCHEAGMNVRAYAARPMGIYHKQVFSVAEQLVPQPGKVPTQGIQPAALMTARETWQKDFSAQSVGLKYAHAAHKADVLEKNKKEEQCLDCHVKLLDGQFTPFPTHAQCIDCHKEVANVDPQIAKTSASKDCLLCHTQTDGGVTRVQQHINYVVFQHNDHGQMRCEQCHAVVTSETQYRPVLRSAAAYPMPMDACYSCHEEKKVTIACLDCHRQHHSYPSTTELVQGWFGFLPFNGVLLTLVGLVGAMGAYTYMDMRLAQRWLATLKPTAPTPADEAAPASEHAEAAEAAGAASGGAIAPPTPAESGLFPYPTIDADTCLPCGTCYDSCPGKVLALSPITHKAAVVTPDACRSISEGCTICHENCPTGAIRISPVPIVRKSERPDIDPNCESHNVPGVFLGGEVLGNALIKKVVNQGGQIVRYIHTRKPLVAEAQYDIIIVGAGPCGLAAGLEAKERGLRYVILERESLANTIQNYPRDKAVLAEPVQMAVYGLLPMKDATKEDLVGLWEDIVRKENLQVKTHEEVTAVKKDGNLLTVTTARGSYQATYVILALGARGNPRKLGVAGEDLPKVSYNLNDPAEWKGKHVLIVGGGDSAIEAAVAISKQPGATVTLSYRSGAFSRAASRNVEAIKEAEKAGRVTVLLNSNVTKVEEKRVAIKVSNDVREIDNEAIFVLIGADPPKAWLEKIGLKFVIVEKLI
jgi:thioredoxin reductase (NADPH)